MKQKFDREKKFFESELIVKENVINYPIYKKLFNELNVKGSLCLDIGCGRGTFSIMLSKGGGGVFGIDLSYTGLKYAKNWAERLELKFNGVQGNLIDMPFKKESFDMFLYGGVLHHFPDLKDPLRATLPFLKKKAKIFLIEPNPHNFIVVLSRFISRNMAKLFGEKFEYAVEGTINETIHKFNDYKKLFEQEMFSVYKELYIDKLPHVDLTKSSFITKSLILIKKFLLEISSAVLPLKYGKGTMVLILKRDG